MTKEIFLEQLEKDKIAEDLISVLKREKLPLILWGCGDVGNAVITYLEKCGVEISGLLLDGEKNEKQFRGYPILNRQELAEQYEKCNVILGHSNYEKGRTLRQELKQVRNVFYAFSISYEQYEKVPYQELEGLAERFVRLCNQVEDEMSVANLMAYLNTKMTGCVDYIFNVYRNTMSFYHNDVFQMSDREVFLDIGAYNGDSIAAFLEETDGRYQKILAVEPDGKSFLELNEYLSRERIRNVITTKTGAWNKQEDLIFKTGNEQISGIDTGEKILKNSSTVVIYADRMDSVFEKEAITFLKINYFEGVAEAIEGCTDLLRKNHPKLAIDVGFDIYNVLKVSEFLAEINLKYKLYLRFNRAMSSTFTLYAV